METRLDRLGADATVNNIIRSARATANSFREPRQGDLIRFSQTLSVRNEGRHEAEWINDHLDGVTSVGRCTVVPLWLNPTARIESMLYCDRRILHVDHDRHKRSAKVCGKQRESGPAITRPRVVRRGNRESGLANGEADPCWTARTAITPKHLLRTHNVAIKWPSSLNIGNA